MDNNRFKCQHCDKDYAQKLGLQRHTVSAHHMRYDAKSGKTTLLSGVELSEAMQDLRRRQYSGKHLADFVPSDEPVRKRRCCKPRQPAQVGDISESTESVESVSVEAPSTSRHTTVQLSTSRLIESDPLVHPFPDAFSVQSDDVDLDVKLHLQPMTTTESSYTPV